MTLRVLDLFSGIGGFSLGLEATGGFSTVAFCEAEPFCRRVLARHWPEVPCYDDVRGLSADALRRDGIAEIDVICGGFPCQDISFAGKRAGLEGARSGLWREYARLIGELRPRFVIVENVPGLLSLGLGDVLGDLAALGYDATWDCIPASAVGAPHRRDRIWLIAHTDRWGCEIGRQPEHGDQQRKARPVTNGLGAGRRWDGSTLADAGEPGLQTPEREELRGPGWGREGGVVAECSGRGAQPGLGRVVDGLPDWSHEPDGVPRTLRKAKHRVSRLKALGNSVVPEIPRLIGLAIMEALHGEGAEEQVPRAVGVRGLRGPGAASVPHSG